MGGIHDTVLRLVGKGGDQGQVKSAALGVDLPGTMDKTASLIDRLRSMANEDVGETTPASGLQEKMAALKPTESETTPEAQGSQLLLARIHALSEARSVQTKVAAAEAPESASPQEGASTPDVKEKIRARLLAVVHSKEGDA